MLTLTNYLQIPPASSVINNHDTESFVCQQLHLHWKLSVEKPQRPVVAAAEYDSNDCHTFKQYLLKNIEPAPWLAYSRAIYRLEISQLPILIFQNPLQGISFDFIYSFSTPVMFYHQTNFINVS